MLSIMFTSFDRKLFGRVLLEDLPVLLFLALMCRDILFLRMIGWRSDVLFVEVPDSVFGMVSGGFGDDFFLIRS